MGHWRRTAMKYTTFASTGEQVSELNLGTMMFGGRCAEAEADRILGLAIERGVNFIDTAAGYGALLFCSDPNPSW